MEHLSKNCSTILSVFFVLTTLFGLTFSAPDFTQFFCSNNIGNYTKNSKYQANLNTLLSSLSTNVSPDGFYNSSVGEDPDRTYALVLCRGDASFQDCENCVNDSANKILQLCPNQKEAIGWYTICMIRYSNKNFFGNMSTRPNFNLQSSVVPPNRSIFNQDLSNLTDSLRDQTVGGSSLKFAAGTRKSDSNITIYALMQCTPDIEGGDCNLCLGWALQVLSQCCYGTEGARVVGPSCSFWYEVFPFYNERVILSRPPPPPPPSLPPSPVPPPPKPATKGKHGNKTTLIIIGAVGGIALGLFSFCIFSFRRKWRNRWKGEKFQDLEVGDGVRAVQYGFGIISAATNNFSSTNLLGKGGFGAVYKGTLSDGKEIAVKRLSKGSGQGDQEFRNEVLLVAKLQHKSLVRLLGFSLKKEERLLVYEFMSNGSLDKFLFDSAKRSLLDWDQRYKIIESVSKGLLYLHEDSRLKIIHRDLKASNILLDEDMNAKISDFGMAKLFQLHESVAETNRVVGTYGYMAPEYALQGICSDKADVFSYGVLVLEIISGQKNRYVQQGQNVEDLLSIVWKNWIKGTASNIIDSTLKAGSAPIEAIVRCIHIGLLCVQDGVGSRPTMASVVFMLHSLSTSLPMPSEPAYFSRSTSIASNNQPQQALEDSKAKRSGQIQPAGGAATNYSLNEASISEFDPR
ncbi:cysteine-rich receptor-like protein kinase 25 isoform X1 [Coffea arabica]|uniref:Cysteine-rich receptor-like protein kinase 25 isoform X1 n=1 Tax=Coffea arabica TaxID=13443 RepID=A0ABM4UWR7_COFAR